TTAQPAVPLLILKREKRGFAIRPLGSSGRGYHGLPYTGRRQRPRAWLALVGIYETQLFAHLAHRWQNLLPEEPQAPHRVLMGHPRPRLVVPEPEDTRSEDFQDMADLRQHTLRRTEAE